MSGLRSYWHSLSLRERMMLSIGGGAAIAIVVYALIWSPLREKVKILRGQVQTQAADLAWMQQQADMVRRTRHLKIAKNRPGAKPVLTMIDQIAKQTRLRGNIKQIQPGKEPGTAKVWFDKVIFEDWLVWLDRITKNGISVDRVTITRSKERPTVNVRLDVQRQ